VDHGGLAMVVVVPEVQQGEAFGWLATVVVGGHLF
jgi:hypothetical protein